MGHKYPDVIGARRAERRRTSQRYYWTSAWQRNERIAVDELAQGLGLEFASPADAIRWLQEDPR